MHEEETANGLLLLVSGDGIPLLVRPYGEVSTPPSAAVGVASALYHAAKRDKCDSNGAAELLALETKHRSIVYEMATMDFLLVFVSDKVCDGCKSSDAMTRRMLRTVLGALLLLLGERNLRDWDVSKLRAAVAKRMEVVDTIVKCFQTDPRFIFGRPVRNVTSYRHLTEPEVSDGTLLQGAWLQNGDLVGEYFQPNGFKILDADELLVLIVLAECVGRREHNYTHHITRVYRERAQTDAKVVIRNSSRGPLTTFIGIFDDKMNEDKMLQETVRRCVLAAQMEGDNVQIMWLVMSDGRETDCCQKLP
ncbi:hypothetical protein PHYBOEH_003923 [Phytophthora boehmeriae]|uniref:Uncharacterized protein n=1 Tax=Phytophthora boehmeriae TaxID=109152 RepID=A0A8T1WQ80_9STRA|nr:hypothetical protein PHYBOEH_003923 [Phytophthora boehmeriae]